MGERVREEYRAFAALRSCPSSAGGVSSRPRPATRSTERTEGMADGPRQGGDVEWASRYDCYFHVGIEEAGRDEFGVMRLLLGVDGENVTFIEEQTGARVTV